MDSESRPVDERSGSILDGNGFDLARKMLDGASEPVRPDDFGPYHFAGGGCLGVGGMGEVWLAEEKPPGRLVAVKFMRSAWSPELRKRFIHEIERLGQLEHHYVARLYGNGSLQDGTPWCAMEYVEGHHLDQYCAERKCPLEKRLSLFRRVCEAVQYAHQSGIIHRDLKPSNILVKADGTPKLLDFGIAKQLDAAETAANPTQTEVRFTRAYASPEQFRREPARASTDVYSLGVILYELLAGRPPYDLSDCTPGDAERIIATREPEKPSLAARTGLYATRAAWNDLDLLCLKAMHKDPHERYQSVEALIRDIDHYLKGEPLEARPDTATYRIGKFVARNRQAVLAASLVLVLIAGMAVFFTVRLARARNAALAEAARTRRIQRFMLDLFGSGDKEAAPASELRVATLLDRGAREAAALNADPETQAELYENLGRMYRLLGRYQKSDELLGLALQKMKGTLSPDDPRIVDALIQLGALRGDQSNPKEAERLVREALSLAGRRFPPADPVVVSAQSALGRVLVQGGSYDQGIAVLDPLMKIQPSGEEGMDTFLETLSAFAYAHHYVGHYQLAESLNRRALELDRQVHGESHPRVAYDLANIATIEVTLGKHAEAEPLYRQAAEILKNWYGPNHPETLQVTSFVGLVLIQQGKLDEAEPLLRNLLAVQEQTYGATHPNVGFTLDTLGKLALKRGEFAAAEADFGRALKIYSASFGETNNQTAMLLAHLGDVFLAEKRYDRAEPLYRAALKGLTARPLKGNVGVGVVEVTLGRVLVRRGNYRDAENHLTSGYAILVAKPSAFPAHLKEAWEDLATVYGALHQPDKAAKFREESAVPTANAGAAARR